MPNMCNERKILEQHELFRKGLIRVAFNDKGKKFRSFKFGTSPDKKAMKKITKHMEENGFTVSWHKMLPPAPPAWYGYCTLPNSKGEVWRLHVAL